MAVWEVVTEALGETVGAALLAPVVIGGIVVAMAASPEMRKRARKWGVQGMAAVLAAREMAGKRMQNVGNGTGGIMSQIGQRVVQAAGEMREEWEDFLAEARSVQEGISRQPHNASRSAEAPEQSQPNGRGGRPRRRTPRARRSAG